MPEELNTAVVELPFHHRVRIGVRKGHNWLQLIRFLGVGATGYTVNLVVYLACLHLLGLDFRVASVVAFIVSVTNNFYWNRRWTFGAAESDAGPQAVKFFAVSLIAYGFTYAVLISLVDGAGLSKELAQAIAAAATTPVNFLGQKLWSFRD
jgi:putative flippase GtrA